MQLLKVKKIYKQKNTTISIMDFVDKKEKLADLLEQFLTNNENKDELISYSKELKQDADFKNKALFEGIFKDIELYLNELSRKELKQRILLIRSFME